VCVCVCVCVCVLLTHMCVQEVRRYTFGSMVILNETAPFEVEGCWLIRGHSMQPLLDANDGAEHYEFTRANTDDPETRKLIGDYWCSMGNINGKAQYDSKVWK
jgi:elongation factor 1-gamma